LRKPVRRRSKARLALVASQPEFRWRRRQSAGSPSNDSRFSIADNYGSINAALEKLDRDKALALNAGQNQTPEPVGQPSVDEYLGMTADPFGLVI